MDGGQCSRQGARTQQSTIDSSIRGAVTLADAAAIVRAEAWVPPPPLSTAVVVNGGGGGKLMVPMAASLTAKAQSDGSGSNVVVAAAV